MPAPAKSLVRCSWITLVVLTLQIVPLGGQVWVEETYEDFVDGEFDASGQNLYVSRQGRISAIKRFDLNQDGYLDLVFNNTHDTYTGIPATVCTVNPDREVALGQLAVPGSRKIVLSDLNRNGFLDAVFCPSPRGVQNRRASLTVLWGSAEGWSMSRSSGLLPVHGAETLAVVDLNRDGWPDIAVLNSEAWRPNHPKGRIIRIFWGSEQGFRLTHVSDFGVENAIDMAAADFDGDGAADLVVLTSRNIVHLFWSQDNFQSLPSPESRLYLSAGGWQCVTPSDLNNDGNLDLVIGSSSGVFVLEGRPGRSWGSPQRISELNASGIYSGDLDGDGWPDLVLVNFSPRRAAGGEAAGIEVERHAVVVLWGDRGRFDDSRSLQLPTEFASAAVIGDVDGDGIPDLIIAGYQTMQSFSADSKLFFGTGGRGFQQEAAAIPTEGATDVVIAPAESGIPARVLFANSWGGTVGERVPLYVYWGGSKGFDPNRRTEIPFRSGYEASAADLNDDGYVDLIALNSMHGGQTFEEDPHAGVNIFWGGPEGFDFEGRRTVLTEKNLGSSAVGDLNRDGYLDLVLGAFDSPGEETSLIIYYGGADGFCAGRRTAIPSAGRSIGSLVADFNRDGWLDIAVASYTADLVRIFWGGPEDFNETRQSRIFVPAPIAIEAADLNSNGYLDLIVPSYADRLDGHQDAGLTVFWGGPSGFQHWNAQWLPGYTPVAVTVADFDGDGFLDIFSANYHGELSRESIPSFLYWGGPEGFDSRRKTLLICDSASDALAGDFDGDGRIDLAVACHATDNSHFAFSKVFYNDGRRFANPRIELLPTIGPHWIFFQDMGHIYDRSWEQYYQSSIFQWDHDRRTGSLQFDAVLPGGTQLRFFVRSAAERELLPKKQWREVTNGSFELAKEHRCLRYRAIFVSPNGDCWGLAGDG